MNYTIEKGIRVPQHPAFKAKYPFHGMDVGDSFKVGPEDKDRVRKAASQHAARNGGRFAVRQDGDGARVWRVG